MSANHQVATIAVIKADAITGQSAVAPLADILRDHDSVAMPIEPKPLIIAASFLATGCGSPSPELPPLLLNATTTGGSNFLCEGRGEEGSVPETASHSPEIVARLRADHPPGSSASNLREGLLRQGFTIHDSCSADRSVSWAEFRQRASNGFGYYTPAFGTVYWKENASGRLVWATGDIAYTGL